MRASNKKLVISFAFIALGLFCVVTPSKKPEITISFGLFYVVFGLLIALSAGWLSVYKKVNPETEVKKK